jgi:hypothetical protein
VSYEPSCALIVVAVDVVGFHCLTKINFFPAVALCSEIRDKCPNAVIQGQIDGYISQLASSR